MGELPGRLMIATNFLGDVHLMPGGSSLSPEIRESVVQAQALVVSVMIRLLHLQERVNGGDTTNAVAEVERLFAERVERTSDGTVNLSPDRDRE